MAPAETQGFLTVFGAPPAPVSVSLIPLTLGRRAGRAASVLAVAWLLGVLSVAIPVAHLVLVPGLLLGGPVLAYLRFRATEVVTRVHGTCPRCGVAQDFEPPGSWGRAMTIDCPRCHSRLALVGLDGPGAPGERPGV